MKKTVSIIVPVYNEVNSIDALLARIYFALDENTYPYEVIFIDDNSTDGTYKKIQTLAESAGKMGNHRKIKLYKKEGIKGKAYSLLQGFEHATGEIIVMIDADLQYPPEAIPQMIKALDKADIVVANRKNYEDGIVRKALSKTFRFAFGNLLFGLNHDVQSGLKVMKAEVVRLIKFKVSSGWTFDLEFLHRAKQAGFIIGNQDITFSGRKNGESKVGFIKTTLEIGMNAIALRTKRIHPVAIPNAKKDSMLGAGVMHKQKKMITHTTLHHSQSALTTFTLWQKALIAGLMVTAAIGLRLNFTLAIIIIVGILSGIYFIDVLFSLFVILKSLYFPPELSFKDSEVKKLKDNSLPVYSILCPLFHEAKVLPDFLKSIEKLDWPKDKLDVHLLLEEDDKETIAAADSLNLPEYIHKTIVPDSLPKTKPKACNYGLGKATGEYLVIFDAEDRPDTDQLKKAYLGFQKAPKNVVCLQAKLNYFNPHQNILTRLFTAEYSLWFDVMLTGLQSINTTIPLGGTSNHFKTKALRGLEGWDPFNVTEDCDLGARIFKKGFKTAIIDSTTWEEANSNMVNWLRQRSRWIKGYMQTYLVHNRHPLQFIKKHGIHAFIFQLIIGARMTFMLINPLLWLMTISYFALYAIVGPTIESFYPPVVFYIAATSLVLGNFMYVYNYMIGCAKRKQWNLIKFVYIIPFYWLMASVSATIALYQLIVKPHYWEKTVHGLQKEEEKVKKFVKKTVTATLPATPALGWQTGFPQRIKNRLKDLIGEKQLLVGGSLLVISNFIINILNYIFNAYLGRQLSFKDYGELSLFTSFISIASIPLGALSTTISQKVAYLYGKYTKEKAKGYLYHTLIFALISSAILTLFWLILIPFLMRFFHYDSFLPFIIFAPVWTIGFLSANYLGYLQGILSFGKLGIISVTEALTKLAVAIILIKFGLNSNILLAIPFSMFVSFLVTWKIASKIKGQSVKAIDSRFNKTFFTASMLSGISTISFLGVDIVLAKHYLTPTMAGQYGVISLVGKIIIFTGSLLLPFVIPIISHNEGASKNSKKTFIFLFTLTGVITGGTYLALGVFGNFFVPLLFGTKSLSILPYLPVYLLAISIFTLTRPIVQFYQAKKNYYFIIPGILLSLLEITLLMSFHNGLNQFVFMLLLASTTYALLILGLYLLRNKLWIVTHFFRDLYGLIFSPSGKNTARTIFPEGCLNILIFNWRDTQHKWAGGAEVYVHELAKRWVKEGNNVTVFCGNGIKRPKNEQIDGVNIIRKGGFYMVYVWAFLYYVFQFRGKYDVIIDCENGIPFFTPLYARKPIFLLIHHVHQDVFRKSLLRPFAIFATFLETKIMPMVYRNVQVITVSPSSRDEIINHNLTKSDPIIIYNGVDLSKYMPEQKSANPLILYLGRLQYYKSLNVFIKAAKEVLRQVPHARFLIAGEGEEKKKLIRLAKKLNIVNHIKFLGKVTEQEKIILFQRAWMFVNPSFMEGWGLTTIEANACGTPAIASDVPGLRDSIKDDNTGLLVPYGKDQEFAQSILRLIKDENLRKELSEEAIRWSRTFTWERSSTELYSLLDQKVKASKAQVVEKKSFAYLISRITSLF